MSIDTSDYIRRIRLSAQKEANTSADTNKFRAPTRDSVYDPYRVVKKNIHLDGFKSPSPKHNVFAATTVYAKYSFLRPLEEGSEDKEGGN